MSRDRFPAGANGKTREAWARRQIALAFGMRPHEAMLYLQGVVREAFGQGKRAGVALASRPGTGEPEVRKCEEPGCETRGMTEAPEWRCAIHHPEHPANTPPPATGEAPLSVPVALKNARLGVPCHGCFSDPEGHGFSHFYSHPPPTVTGEAGPGGEVEKARAAFYEAGRKWAEASKRDIACGAPFPSQERRDARMNTVACHMDALHAYDALLAAEARALPEAREGGRSVP